MASELHLSFNNRNARVVLIPSRPKPKTYRQVSPRHLEVSTLRIESGALPLEPDDATIQSLIEADPDIDIERVGRPLDDVTRAYYNPKSREIARNFKVVTVQYGPDGEEKERKPFQKRKPNINEDNAPVQLGKLVPMDAFFARFVVERAYQLGHDDGLKYEFLHDLAKMLAEKRSVALLGAGAKGQSPLVFKDNGRPFRCGLTGQVDGERYRLLVLLLGQELKIPEGRETEEAGS